ncbi:MAG: hypothetical protein QG596_1098 [Actinomycetota bacterium]|jgi:hypothetical protein|nr:hypothetical protein [Actinomycetota bacterium]
MKTTLKLHLCLLVLLSLGALSVTSAGAWVPALDEVATDKGEVAYDDCRPWVENVKPLMCVYGNPESKTTVALVGDSHALQWGPPLIRLAKRRDWRLVTFIRANCPIAAVPYERYCDQWRSNAFEAIEAERPRHVIVSTSIGGRYRLIVNGEQLSRRASEPMLVRGMTRTLRRLNRIPSLVRRGTRVKLIRDQVTAPFLPPLCLERRQLNPASCRFRPTRLFGPGFDWVAAKQAGILPAIDPVKVLCRPKWCYSHQGEMVVYRDTDHISATFARTLTGWLGARLGF